ncbi:MAG: F0F1 ATP synthase subunit B' [Pseudomonadota bacterium]
MKFSHCFYTIVAFAGSALGLAQAAEESTGLPQLNTETFASQVFWMLIVFALLYFLCAKVFLPRLGNIIEERRNRIADDYDQAADFKRQAEAAEEAYNHALADAKANAAQIAAETKASLDAETREMEAETDTQLEADLTAAEDRIAQSAARASTAIREAATETTKAVVSAMIDETPSTETVEAALNNVGGQG